MEIYFDSAATARPSEAAINAARDALSAYGNPSSVHKAGMTAKRILDDSRKKVAKALFCKPEEVIFTSCGSESNSQCIYGLARLRARRSKRIITTDCEHPSVALPIAALAEEGFEAVKIPTLRGALDLELLERELSKGAAFVSIMLVNNETGALFDIAAVRRLIDRSGCGALLHCDAVQGFLKVDNSAVIAKNCDCASLSAHKIGGFKGVGAVYMKNGLKLPPFIRGGGQESGYRSGTENVLGIVSFAAACESYPNSRENIKSLSEKLKGALEKSEYVKINAPVSAVPSIISVQVPGVRAEVMLNALSAEGICVSAGSACSARKGPSNTLVAFGLNKSEIESTVRISLGEYNTEKECELLVGKIEEIAKRLKR